jgi:eukaryotic-like serine/threonine-protein kinase
MLVLFKQLFSKSLLWCALILCTISWFSCKKDHLKPAQTGITSFALLNDSNKVVQSATVFKGDSILISVPSDTDIPNLISQITLVGATISPASGFHVDFTQPVVYTVTLSDGSSKIYFVKVTPGKLKNVVYTGTGNGVLYALNATNGSIIWQQSPGGNFSYSSPALAGEIIYAGNTDGNMYAYAAGTGRYLWSFKTGLSIESSPLVSSGNVYFGGDDHNFYAVNAQSGVLSGKFPTNGNVSSSPLVYNGIVYFGSDDGNFYALDAATGNLKWKYATNSIFNASSPVQLNGIIYVGNRNGNFIALDAALGQAKWSFSSGGISFEMARPVIVNGIIYVASWYNTANFSQAGSVYAINAATGTQIWTALPGTGFSTGPAADNGELFISGDNGSIYALDQTSGIVLWNNAILPNGAIPAAKNGIMYVGGGGTGYFYAFDERTGSIKWTYKISSLNTSRPYVIDANGN